MAGLNQSESLIHRVDVARRHVQAFVTDPSHNSLSKEAFAYVYDCLFCIFEPMLKGEVSATRKLCLSCRKLLCDKTSSAADHFYLVNSGQGHMGMAMKKILGYFSDALPPNGNRIYMAEIDAWTKGDMSERLPAM